MAHHAPTRSAVQLAPRAGFTLIELLVVIAILAVLAAILFPVFGRAKTAAKRTDALSRQRQIGFGLLLYTGDYHDRYPAQDRCEPGSLNPELDRVPFPAQGLGRGCTVVDYRYRVNHFSWQKYVRPYLSGEVSVFEHPLRAKDPEEWETNGQIVGSFALNIGLTGARDTLGRPLTFLRQIRNSWRGGSIGALPSPSGTAILLEVPGTTVAMAPSLSIDDASVGVEVTVYPVAVREFWRYKLRRGGMVDCILGREGTEPDPRKVADDRVAIGMADGSARSMSTGEFLAKTPPKAEVFMGTTGSHNAGWTFGNDCVTPAGNLGVRRFDPTVDYPLWGLGQ